MSDFVKGYLHGAFKTFKNDSVDSLINYVNERNEIAYFWNNENIQKMCNYKENKLNGILKYGVKIYLLKHYIRIINYNVVHIHL